MKYDVVVIGAGLGGLETAYILSKHGMNVCVLEQGLVIGGCIQNFKRKGTLFDTGFHYVGSMSEGESLRRIFDYFNVSSLPFHKLDEDCFDEVIYKGESYSFANGHNNFVNTLSSKFPNQKENLRKFVSTLKSVGDGIFGQFNPKETDRFYSASLFAKGAYDFLKETITDNDLLNVLSGTCLKMDLRKETLPLYTFAQIQDSFIRSAYRIKGGGQQIAERLAEGIREMGGQVLTNSKVVEIVESDGLANSVVLDNGERIEAGKIVSNLHPAATLELIKESSKIRKIYRNRISNLANTCGIFTVNIKLKTNTLKYLNRNIYIHTNDDVWEETTNTESVSSVLVSFQVPEDGSEYTGNIDILAPQSWKEVSQWDGTKVMRRGEEYDALKKNKAEECISIVEKHIPDLRSAIDTVYTDTPLTYKDYVSTPTGSAYGIQKDYNAVMQTVLTPRTPIDNLYLTGQSLNLHGILGVSMTSFFTAAEILGMDSATEGLF